MVTLTCPCCRGALDVVKGLVRHPGGWARRTWYLACTTCEWCAEFDRRTGAVQE